MFVTPASDCRILKFGARIMDRLSLYLGRRIQARRREIGMVAEDLADALGISERELGKIEAGWRRPPADQLIQIAKSLGVRLADLFA